jgi:hypothetical protein
VPPTSPADATRVLQLQHAELVLAVRRWLRRLPRGHQLGRPEDVLESVTGALWVELVQSPNPAGTALSCLRRVLYREFERRWRQAPCSLDTQSERWIPVSRQDAVSQLLDLPAHLVPWAEEYLRYGGPQGRLEHGAAICGSRRQTRLRNTALFEALSSGQFHRDLERRAARLLSATAIDGPRPCHVRAARDIQNVLKMLESTPKLASIRAAVSNIAALRTPASHAETAESANA